jgi:hypothetical protein
MTTLFDMALQAHTKVGTIRFDTSSAGTSVAVNSQTYSSATADDDFNNGTLFIISSTNAGTSLIDGQFRRISDYDASSGEFTLSSGLSTAVTDGTRFGYTTPEFPHELVVELANQSLQSIGPLDFIDRTIVSSANQQVYNISTAAKYSRIKQVDIMGTVGSSTNDPEWRTLYDWTIEPSSAAGTNLLILGEQPMTGRDIRITFEGHHHRVVDSTANIDERIHPELAALVLVEKMYEYRNSLNRGSVEFDRQRWNDAKAQVAEFKIRFPIWRKYKKPQILTLGNQTIRNRDHAPWPPPYGPS